MNVKDWADIWVSVKGCPVSFCLAAIRLCSRLWSPGTSCSYSLLPAKHTLCYLQGSATGMRHWIFHLCHTVNISNGSHDHHLHGDHVKCNKQQAHASWHLQFCQHTATAQSRCVRFCHTTPSCMRGRWRGAEPSGPQEGEAVTAAVSTQQHQQL